jgi:hypothetical protein
MVILSGCVTKNSRTCVSNLDLPVMPLAGSKVADELETVCTGNKCYNLNNWLNELYLFREQYQVYKSIK